VGAALLTKDQANPRSLPEVLAANAKRLQEALRSLEEFGRVRSPGLAAAFGRLRFRAYTLESELAAALAARPGRVDGFGAVRLYVILTRDVARRSLTRVAEEVLAGGADALQLREKTLTDRAYLGLARRLRRITERAGRPLLLNDRVHLALACGADGVHVGAEDLPVAQARRLLGPDRLVGATCHTGAEQAAAERDGADYVSAGPIFGAATKFAHRAADARAAAAAALPAIGPAAVAAALKRVRIPVVAIGGITPENVAAVARAGARCVAVCAGVIARPDPAAAARAIRRALTRGARGLEV
ncbi:MAG: thiamine phosphate synthase, partial [Planctomycetes bacterium]|nr:thiamine phosphate synthase [Planctomycetota bacterium]